jgi:hypothetical protein
MAANGEPYSVAARNLDADADADADAGDVDPAATDPGWWPTRDQVLDALAATSNRQDLHKHWRQVLGRLERFAERHATLTRALLTREREALARPVRHDPTLTRPSASLAVFDAVGAVGGLETEELMRYAYLAQAALELAAAGGHPPLWSAPIPGEEPAAFRSARSCSRRSWACPRPWPMCPACRGSGSSRVGSNAIAGQRLSADLTRKSVGWWAGGSTRRSRVHAGGCCCRWPGDQVQVVTRRARG